MFKKRIAIELAVGIIILIALIIGGSIWLQTRIKPIKMSNLPVEIPAYDSLKSKAYYDAFRKQCGNSVCCLESVNNSEKNNSLVFNAKEIKCLDGFSPNRLECIDGYAWCEKDDVVGIANPASVYCEQNGGKLEIQTEADGGQTGICTLTDGTKCEEWAFMRGECTLIWKTYKNEKYGFEIKYPENWKIIEQEWNSQSGLMMSLFLTNNREMNRAGLSTPNRKAPEGELIYSLSIQNKNISKPEKYKFLGSLNNLDYIALDDFRNPEDANFNKIFNTFKFIDGDTVNWKTYKNEALGFEFQYPEKIFNWKVDEKQTGTKDTISFYNSPYSADSPKFLITLIPNKTNQTIDEWWKGENKKDSYFLCKSQSNDFKGQIASQKIIALCYAPEMSEGEYHGVPDSKIRQVFIHNGYIFDIYFSYGDGEFSDYEQMLSTFKFTN